VLHSLLVRILKTELGALPERVQNEVAALALAREPLRPVVRLPDVYAWSEGRGADETPFIVLGLLPGFYFVCMIKNSELTGLFVL
jgi:hypothetical protein